MSTGPVVASHCGEPMRVTPVPLAQDTSGLDCARCGLRALLSVYLSGGRTKVPPVGTR